MFGKVMMGAVYTALIGGAVLFHEGAITVNVQEKKPDGDRVFVFAPAAVVPWAIALAPERHVRFDQMPEEARAMLPALAEAADKLGDMPDFVLVEVQSPREHVKVEKRGGSIVVNVDSERESVYVSVPLRAARHALAQLSARKPAEKTTRP
ncbi:MAG: hypothetical protein L0Z50_18390 [Verrucomicrobiales bacterium]|nr:hypothetical protein [Verrucomicrobiales bacterium]